MLMVVAATLIAHAPSCSWVRESLHSGITNGLVEQVLEDLRVTINHTIHSLKLMFQRLLHPLCDIGVMIVVCLSQLGLQEKREGDDVDAEESQVGTLGSLVEYHPDPVGFWLKIVGAGDILDLVHDCVFQGGGWETELVGKDPQVVEAFDVTLTVAVRNRSSVDPLHVQSEASWVIVW